MRSSKSKPCRTLFQLLAFMSAFRHGHALSQQYCSSQNTGSDYSAVNNIYQSNGACQTECAANYAFAVVQYKDCWCSNYAPSDQEDVSDCNTACPGYPSESCGNSDKGLYGYIALNKSPSGTQGASSSASSTQASRSTQQKTSSPAPVSSSSEASQDTVYSSVSVTVYSTVQQSPSVVVSYVTLSSSSSSTSSTPSSTTSRTSSTISSITVTSELAATTPTSDDFTHTTLVSTRVLTVSGAPVTQTVTSTPMVTNANAQQQQASPRKSVSAGSIAGAVVGAILGVALLLIGAFLIWRRRRPSDSGAETLSTTSSSARRKMERNISVLSKTGLLSSGGATHDVEKSSYDTPGYLNTSTNKRSSAMYAAGGANAQSPVSPIGGGAFDDSSQRSRRNSRPLVYDQRLNPDAIMQNWESNGSRVSIGTMQDQRDYSRPLGVTNPDPVDD